MRTLVLLLGLTLACSVACTKKSADQSFADGMRVLCEADEHAEAKDIIESANPADRQRLLSEWIDKRLHNAEARELFDTLGDVDPQTRAVMIVKAIRKAGLTRCMGRDMPRVTDLSDDDLAHLPVLSDTALQAFDPSLPLLVIRPDTVLVDGVAVAPASGDKPGSPVTFGAGVSPMTGALVQFNGSGTALNIAVRHTTPFRRVIEVMMAASRAPAEFRSFNFLVGHDSGIGALSFRLPETPDPAAARDDAATLAREDTDNSPDPDAASDRTTVSDAPEPPLSLVVSIHTDTLRLWSISGLEGTIQAPRATLPLSEAHALRPVLAEIVARRWPDGDRPASSRQIILMADNATKMATILEVAGACQGGGDGPTLFPDVQFSPSF